MSRLQIEGTKRKKLPSNENDEGYKRRKRSMSHDGSNFELVGDFMEAFGQQVRDVPMWPDFNTRELRLDLIHEELEELEEAMSNKDMVEIADALTDLLYVIYGAGHAFGMDLDACFLEVHDSNMSKLGPDGRAIRREDGKVLKSENFFAPDLGPILGL
tara:strand:- start:283 stop:756 length:474 start_codon:yes stop_codon:yes gene_type:complete